MQPSFISSKDNAKYKQLLKLTKKRERDKTNLFIIEGLKEIEFAINAEYKFTSIWICSQKSDKILQNLAIKSVQADIYIIPEALYERVKYRNLSEGIIGICNKISNDSLTKISTELKKEEESCILILDNIQKPGNIGAMLRSADGAGIDGVVLTNQSTDIYSQSAIRSSVGTFFTTKWQIMTENEALAFCKENGFNIITADPFSKNLLGNSKISLPSKSAFILGNEHHGLSEFWSKNNDLTVKIPMLGKNDSLNVSVSCAILLYSWRLYRST